MMLAVVSSVQTPPRCTPNVVPCRIQYTGPAKVTKRYWAPVKDKDGNSTAHFRGRRLRGRTAKLPGGYRGFILESTEKTLPQDTPAGSVPLYEETGQSDEEELEALSEPVKIVDNIATFDEIVVWGHDQVPAADDIFVKNIEEWIGFAEAIHGTHGVNQSIDRIAQNGSITSNE